MGQILLTVESGGWAVHYILLVENLCNCLNVPSLFFRDCCLLEDGSRATARRRPGASRVVLAHLQVPGDNRAFHVGTSRDCMDSRVFGRQDPEASGRSRTRPGAYSHPRKPPACSLQKSSGRWRFHAELSTTAGPVTPALC